MGQPLLSARSGTVFFAVIALIVLLIVIAALVLSSRSSGGGGSGLVGLIRSFADGLPPAEARAYRAPTEAERGQLTLLARAVVGGNIESARAIAAPLGLAIVPFHDEDSGRDLYVVRETGLRRRGWGLLVVAPSAPSSLVVEAPHPIDDRFSEDLAARVFLEADARVLLVAGASRDALPDGAADVAHRDDSAFEAMHRGLLQSGTTVMQVHGYDAGSRDAAYGDVVLSSGTTTPGPIVEHLADVIRAAGIRVCVYDGENCAGLGGVTNVQGASTRDADGNFVHVEVSERLREDDLVRDDVARLLAQI